MLNSYQGGTTSTDDAMRMIQDNSKYFPNGPGDRADAINVVLVITDGVPYPDSRRQPALDLAQQAQNRGITMFVVGITNAVDEEVLKGLSSAPRVLNHNYFTSADFDALEEITDTVARQTCTVTVAPGTCKFIHLGMCYGHMLELHDAC